jgi:hypothetical protein
MQRKFNEKPSKLVLVTAKATLHFSFPYQPPRPDLEKASSTKSSLRLEPLETKPCALFVGYQGT